MNRSGRVRRLGTMVVFGYVSGDLGRDLALARRLGVDCVEILPNWRSPPDPAEARRAVAEAGFDLWSAHGSWGGHSISGARVDLASVDPATRSASVDDIRRCVDWLAEAGGRTVVVHPGGLSDPAETAARSEALAASLVDLGGHLDATGVDLAVENMPRGVHPGSRMADLARLVAGLGHPRIGLAIDTGHGQISGDLARETQDAGRFLLTSHVHDNDGRHDSHLPPGGGTVDWTAWVEALDRIGYEGPIVLECIKLIRETPGSINPSLLGLLDRLAGPA